MGPGPELRCHQRPEAHLQPFPAPGSVGRAPPLQSGRCSKCPQGEGRAPWKSARRSAASPSRAWRTIGVSEMRSLPCLLGRVCEETVWGPREAGVEGCVSGCARARKSDGLNMHLEGSPANQGKPEGRPSPRNVPGRSRGQWAWRIPDGGRAWRATGLVGRAGARLTCRPQGLPGPGPAQNSRGAAVWSRGCVAHSGLCCVWARQAQIWEAREGCPSLNGRLLPSQPGIPQGGGTGPCCSPDRARVALRSLPVPCLSEQTRDPDEAGQGQVGVSPGTLICFNT